MSDRLSPALGPSQGRSSADTAGRQTHSCLISCLRQEDSISQSYNYLRQCQPETYRTELRFLALRLIPTDVDGNKSSL